MTEPLFAKLRELEKEGFTLFVPAEGATINDFDFEVDEKTFAGFYQKTEVDKVVSDLPKLFAALDLMEKALIGFSKHCIKPQCRCWACEALAKAREMGKE